MRDLKKTSGEKDLMQMQKRKEIEHCEVNNVDRPTDGPTDQYCL